MVMPCRDQAGEFAGGDRTQVAAGAAGSRGGGARGLAGGCVTATEAERNRRRGLTPWWRVRSWSKDLDTLIRLHKGLRALDADAGAEQEPLSAPALSAPPAELLAPPQDEVADEDDGPAPSPVSDQASDPDAAYPHETTAPAGTAGHEAPVQEMPARQMLPLDATPQALPDTEPSRAV